MGGSGVDMALDVLLLDEGPEWGEKTSEESGLCSCFIKI